jgi:RNA polymerase sigma factor for flagellar operon FliA
MDRLWHTFHHDTDAVARDRARARLIEAHQHLAAITACAIAGSRQFGGHVDRDDLTGAALYALIKAVDEFDPKRKVQFVTWAVSKMRGAVLEHLRNMDWVTRTARTQISEGFKAREKILEAQGAPVDVATEDAAHVHELKRRNFTDHVGASAPRSPGPSTLTLADLIPDPSPGPEEIAAEHDGIEYLLKRVDKLPPREQMVIRLYYGNEMLLREIAERLAISESRVFQLRARALQRLHSSLLFVG